MERYRRAFWQREQIRFQEKEKRRQNAKRAVYHAVEPVISHYPTVQRVYLFGSVLKPGAFDADSDIDIGVEGADTALCFDIWRELEQAIPEWTLDVRSLDSEDTFAERVRRKGELIYEQSAPDS
jgi:predicted nucleotidyltransferase